MAGQCVHDPVDAACDDANPCTDDTCDPTNGDAVTGCLFTPNDANTCPDGDSCTHEACVSGTCVITAVDCTYLDDDCTFGVCDAQSGQCETQPANQGSPCEDDQNECTLDVCDGGSCTHVDNGMCAACCLADSSCVEITSDTCIAQGGTPAGGVDGLCGNDSDGDGVDDLCDACPGVDDAEFGDCPSIPTVSEWGLVALVLLLLVAAKIYFGGARRQLA